ncbi:HAMP domain-containing histidine kinase [Jatrophihabitans telluris]|uniref:histidine kinase n=1 Tax=Jatrophihabitans telluris TaxID=2038343 RepID=A0ABY4QU39_9ACTN|nr:HAMP domain-containing sensor histidine kinase [Jatrophihabitans telluris]UQX86616.1 HAMP domain-containing histidine kinase [Jatrophihabitans telluris]
MTPTRVAAPEAGLPRRTPVPGALARMPLRVKLIATVLLLVTLTLVGSGAVGVTTMRSYLLGRVDSQLRAVAQHPSADLPIAGSAAGTSASQQNGNDSGGDHHRLPSAFVLEVTDSKGAITYGPTSDLIDPSEPLPELPRLTGAHSAARGSQTFSTGAVTGSGQWQVLIRPVTLTDGSQGTLLVAQSLGDVQQTIDRLSVLLAMIGAVAVVIVAGVGYLIVRASLRPLRQVEHTAAAIAAGDLARRVPTAHPATEVGQLSAALNTMLTEIETAFAAREASAASARRSEQQMRASEAAARESEQRMRRFVADASHELRTPLTSIRGFAELYRQGAAPSPPEVQRLMGRIEDEAKRMGLLVEDLLMLARLDQQRPLARTPVDLLALAADAVHDAQAVNPAHIVRLELGATDPPPIVTGDEPRLRQILANLLGNAVQHTPAGTAITVSLSTVPATAAASPDADGDMPAGARVILAVADDGPGLSEHDAAHIFERFYRTDRSRSRNDGGTGLGLSIVAALVAGHGGTVSVRSDHGACFLIELPLAEVRAPSA